MSDNMAVHASSGNVFADLGIENPDEYLAKSATWQKAKHWRRNNPARFFEPTCLKMSRSTATHQPDQHKFIKN